MKHLKILTTVALIILVFSSAAVACKAKAERITTFDPAKTYQAALAINLPAADAALEKIKQRAIAEGYELGPIEYYEPGETDFAPFITKMMSQAHVNVLWIACGIMDVPTIQKAVAKAGYTGETRLMPVTGATPYQSPK